MTMNMKAYIQNRDYDYGFIFFVLMMMMNMTMNLMVIMVVGPLTIRRGFGFLGMLVSGLRACRLGFEDYLIHLGSNDTRIHRGHAGFSASTAGVMP